MIRRTTLLFALILFLGILADGFVRTALFAVSRGKPMSYDTRIGLEFAAIGAVLVSVLGAIGYLLMVVVSRAIWSKWPSRALERAAILGALVVISVSALNVPQRVSALVGRVALWPYLAVVVLISAFSTVIALFGAWLMCVRPRRTVA